MPACNFFAGDRIATHGWNVGWVKVQMATWDTQKLKRENQTYSGRTVQVQLQLRVHSTGTSTSMMYSRTSAVNRRACLSNQSKSRMQGTFVPRLHRLSSFISQFDASSQLFSQTSSCLADTAHHFAHHGDILEPPAWLCS